MRKLVLHDYHVTLRSQPVHNIKCHKTLELNGDRGVRDLCMIVKVKSMKAS